MKAFELLYVSIIYLGYNISAKLQQFISTGSDTEDADPAQPSVHIHNYKLEFYSDISTIDNQSPATIEDAITRLRSIIKIEDDDAKPCSYVLVPLTSFANNLNITQLSEREVQRIDRSLLNDILRIFIDLRDRKLKLNYVEEIFSQCDQYVPANEKREILFKKMELEQTETEMKHRVADCVKDIRSKRKGEADLVFIKERFSRSCFVQNLDKFLVDMEHILKKIVFISNVIAEGVCYIANFEEIDETSKGEFYVFFYCSSGGEHEELAKNMQLFNKLAEQNKTSCFFADLDVYPHISKVRDIPNGTRICYFVDGNFTNKDVLKTYQDERVFCYMKSDGPMKIVKQNPTEKIQLKLICPQSIGNGKCRIEKHLWFCKNCQSPIEYGFDAMFYCKCGRDYAKNFQYHCSDFNHGDSFASFAIQEIEKILSDVSSMPKLNILVLGETGVGKSTWINGIANYMTFKTLKEASEAKEVLCLIPTKFTLLENFKEKVVAVGTSENECNIDGQACTQHPMAHLFDVDGCLIRIIDTPGIGDPRGVEQDKENLDNVITFASNFDEIHGICILLKPNNAKLHTYFRFCILEMLTHLNKSAIKNIMFCFTNTRSTFYKPGDTYPALKKLLDEINTGLKSKSLDNMQQPELILSESTMYCMDNESFRFLCARRCNVDFSDADFKNFALSWERSVNETNRMLDHIKMMQPHKTVETIFVNDARQKILLLAKPMAKISDNIAKNIRVAEEQKKFTKTLKEEEMMLMKNRMRTQISITTEKVSEPQTVCTSPQCIQLRTIPGTNEKKIIYKTICHANCELQGIYEDVVGAEGLRKCWAMRGTDWCKNCTCPWAKHMHITYKFKEESVLVEDLTVEKLIREKSKDRSVKIQMITALEKTIQDYKAEQEKILEISSKFGSFLKNHAILPYNDAFEAHVRHELDLATADAYVTGDNTKVHTLKGLLEQYAEKKKLLDKVMVNTVGGITFDDIEKLKTCLMSLPLTGKSFRDCFETAQMSLMTTYRGSTQVAITMPQLQTTYTQQNTTMLFWERVKNRFRKTSFY